MVAMTIYVECERDFHICMAVSVEWGANPMRRSHQSSLPPKLEAHGLSGMSHLSLFVQITSFLVCLFATSKEFDSRGHERKDQSLRRKDEAVVDKIQ